MDEAISLSSRSAPRALGMRRLETSIVLGAWTALVVTAFALGRSLVASGHAIAINAPPLFGRFDVRISAKALPAVAVAIAAVVYAPRLATRLSWKQLLVVSAAGTVVWSTTLALIDGVDGLLGALEGPHDYLAALPLADTPVSFLSNFTENLASFPVHVQGHPPGMVVWLWGLDAVGLSGAGWAAVLIVLAASSTTVAALVAVRDLAGERSARACAPYLVIIPAALWIATSADALFMTVSAWGVALFVLSTGRRDRAGDVLAGVSGLLLGWSLFLSYGLALLAPVVCAVAVARRRWRSIVVAGVAVGAVVGLFVALGFWWLDGLTTTLERYDAGVAGRRPQGFFVVNNLAAFGVALGPALAVAVARLKDRRLWVVVGATLVAIAVADLSGLSKGEVERIWLPFLPWVAIAAAALAGSKRGWLALQAVTALSVAMLVRTPW